MIGVGEVALRKTSRWGLDIVKGDRVIIGWGVEIEGRGYRTAGNLGRLAFNGLDRSGSEV